MWLTLLACQAPFGADRHDLLGFRIAAMSVPPAGAGDTIVPELALIVDGHPWSDDPVDLLWYWVEDTDAVLAIDPLTPLAGLGPAPSLVVPEDGAVLAVRAILGDREERAFVILAAPPATLEPFAVRAETIPLTIAGAEGPDLLLPAREALSPTSEPGIAPEIAPGDFVRLTAYTGDGDPLVRWMATAGTFFELDRQVADWAAGELVLDDDQIEDGRTVLDEGSVTFIALALGNAGETQFSSFDLTVGPHGDGLIVGGRILPTRPPAVDFGSGVAGTLVIDDTSPTGVRLDNAEPLLGDVEDWGTDALPCGANLEGPFNPRVLLNGICPRTAIDGFDVVVRAEGTW